MNKTKISLLVSCLFASQLSVAETSSIDAPVVSVSAARVNNDTYNTLNASTATKLDIPILDTPASVQVINHQMLEDQKATTLNEALQNASGVRSSNTGWEEQIYLRGFSTSTYFRDGFRVDDPSGLGGLLSLSNVDSIEVLKGPGAILYGRVEPGGIVNIITKQPQSTPYYSIEQSVGSWNHYITKLDATGPLNEQQDLLYRVNFSYDTSQLWVDNVSDKRFFFAPTLEYKIDPRNTVQIEASYSHDQSTLYQQALVPYDTTNHQFLWGNKSNNPEPYFFNPDTLFLGLSWAHEFNDDWSIKQRFSHNQVNFSTPLNLSQAYGPLCGVANTSDPQTCSGNTINNATSIGLGSAQLSGRTRSDGIITDLTGHFDLFDTKHTVLLGADYYDMNATYNSRYSNPNGPFTFVPLFSSNAPSPSSIPLDPDNYYSTNTSTKSLGAYFQDQIKLGNKVDFLLGFRYQDVSTSGFVNQGVDMGGTGFNVPNPSHTDHAVTPRFGVVYKPESWLSLYASYAENFGATNAATLDWQGNPLKPEGATQYEIGAKSELLDGKGSLTFALFNLTKNNMAVNDFAHPNPGCGGGCYYQTNLGQIASNGVEITLQGEFLTGWNILAAYTYDHVYVKQGSALYPDGSNMPFVPDQMVRVFSTYKFSNDWLQGWKVGGGVNWQSSSSGVYSDPNTYSSDTSTIHSPSYAVYDAMAAYDFKFNEHKTSLQLNVKNLFNKNYYTDAFMYMAPWGYVTYGQPRSVLATLKIEF